MGSKSKVRNTVRERKHKHVASDEEDNNVPESDDEKYDHHHDQDTGGNQMWLFGVVMLLLCGGLFANFMYQLYNLGIDDGNFLAELDKKMKLEREAMIELVDDARPQDVSESSEQQYQGDKDRLYALRKPKKSSKGKVVNDDENLSANIMKVINEWKKDKPIDNELSEALQAENPGLLLLEKRQAVIEHALEKVESIEGIPIDDITYHAVNRKWTMDDKDHHSVVPEANLHVGSNKPGASPEGDTQASSAAASGKDASKPRTKVFKSKTMQEIRAFVSKLRSSGLYASFSTASKSDKSAKVPGFGMFNSYLKHLGYKSLTTVQKSSKKSVFPVWQNGYGMHCPAKSAKAGDKPWKILLCSLVNTPVDQFMPYEELMGTASMLSSSSDPEVIALSSRLVPRSFLPDTFSYNDADQRERMRQVASAQNSAVFTVFFNHGHSRPQFTEKIVQVLESSKIDESKKLLAQLHPQNPFLWGGRAVTLRTFALVLNVNPLLVLYHQGGMLRSKTPYLPFASSQMSSKNFMWKSHFPGLKAASGGEQPDYMDVADLKEYLVQHRLVTSAEYVDSVLFKRMKQLTAYAMISLIKTPHDKTLLKTQPKSLTVQHMCVDFYLDNALRPVLQNVLTGCPIPSPDNKAAEDMHRAMSLSSIKVAEEAFYIARNGTKLTYNMFSNGAIGALEPLVDEVAVRGDQDKLLLESLGIIDYPADGAEAPEKPLDTGHVEKLKQQVSEAVASNQAPACEAPVSVSFLQPNSVAGELQRLWRELPACESQFLRTIFAAQNGADKDYILEKATVFTEEIRTSMGKSLDAAKSGSWRAAASFATQGSYQLCLVSSHQAVSLVWRPLVRGNAFLAIKVARCKGHPQTRPLVLEVPHPYFDHTRAEGIQLFARGNARVLLLSGSHRCAEAALSGCTGSVGRPVKTNCPGHTAYTDADVAHSVNNLFYTTHVHLVESSFPTDLVVSLHSTKQPTFVVSDGTSHGVEASTPVAQLGTLLSQSFKDHNVDICNPFPDSPSASKLTQDEQAICGATNMQGRHMNGAANPCVDEIKVTGEPLTASGRFIHIEQPVELIKQQAAVRDTVAKVAVALHKFFAGRQDFQL